MTSGHLRSLAAASSSKEKIWIFGRERLFCSLLGASLGKQFKIRQFREAKKLQQAVRGEEKTSVSLFVFDADVKNPCGTEIFIELSRMAPLIVISSANDVETISRHLRFGAADVLLKPVDLNLLTAKVRELIKRHTRAHLHFCSYGLWFDQENGTVLDEFGGKVRLTRREFQLLLNIARASPPGIFRTELYSQVWGDLKVVDKALDVHIFHLRRKLAPLGFTIHYAREGKYSLLKELT